MSKPVEEMTKEQLMAELPKRMVVMALFLAGLCVVMTIIGFITMRTGFNYAWLATFVVTLLSSPLVVRRVARWMVLPAHERRERRRASMYRALAEFSFPGGDSRV